jgi:hypothetical protein
MTSHFRIARNVFLGLAIGCCAAAGVGQDAQASDEKQTLQITLSPDNIEVASGADLVLYAQVCNLSAQTVVFISTISNDNLDTLYDYSIHDSSGKAVPLTHPTDNGSRTFHPGGIGPGQCGDYGIQGLMTAFAMRQPGVYKIQVSRYDLGHQHLLGTSNVVTVTVTAQK